MTKPRIAITYCTQCHWLLRAGWMAQELLSTFSDELGGAGASPRDRRRVPDRGGRCDQVWERKRDGGFPVKTLKQRVRDHLAPGRDLGHIDR